MFTHEQIREIKEKLALLGSKDNNLPIADLPLDGNETIAIIQDGKNRKVSIDNFYSQFENHINQSKVDFFNVSVYAMNISEETEIAYYTLAEAIELCPEEVRKSGQVITFLDKNDNWQIWQFISSDSINWSNVDECWKNLEDKIGLGITLTSTILDVPFGTQQNVTFHFETIDGGNASEVKIYKNSASDLGQYSLVGIRENVSAIDYELEGISTTTKFKIIAKQYGEEYEKEIVLPMSYPAWIGAGNDTSDIRNDNCKFNVNNEIKDSYEIEFNSTSYLMITIPWFVILNPITMNGFEVPMREQTSRDIIDGLGYVTYQSANKYIAGIHKFMIGVYEEDERELMSSVLSSLNGLNTIIEQNNETNVLQEQSINSIESRVSTLEDNTYNTTDDEDLTIIDNKYKFADKNYNPTEFSGKGRVYLRKNIITIEEVDPNDSNVTIQRRVNFLPELMVTDKNKIYILQYDYVLRGGTITMPEGSVLQYAGGTLSGGTLDVTGAILLQGWENIIGEDLTVIGIPAVGSMYFNTEENTLCISNGENWIKISGEIVYNENNLDHDNDELDGELDGEQDENQNNEDTPI